WLALQLERKYSKEEILEMYLNKIYYGNNAYGVGKGAETYFGKDDLSDLNLLESAMLAGLPQRPSGYNPFDHPENMQKRVDTVLTLMERHDKITAEEAEEARKTDVSSVDRKSTRLNSSHVSISYAVFCLKKKQKKHKQWTWNKKKRRQI